jgi:hypothetical protein
MSMIRSSDCDAIARPHRWQWGARVRSRRLLFDGDGRRQAVDQIDVRLLHLLEKLAGVGRQGFDVAPLALGVNRVKGKRGFARTGQSGNNDQLVARKIDVYVLEVVYARAAYRNPVVGHSYCPDSRPKPKQ